MAIKRDVYNQRLAGVCSGLGKEFHIDPAIIRLLFILITMAGGAGIPIYCVLWAIMPSNRKPTIPWD